MKYYEKRRINWRIIQSKAYEHILDTINSCDERNRSYLLISVHMLMNTVAREVSILND